MFRLCGFSPFLSSTQTGLFEKIIKVEYDFPDPEWTNISSEAKDFIKHLLVKDPNERWTAKQCKEHPWLSVCPFVILVLNYLGILWLKQASC